MSVFVVVFLPNPRPSQSVTSPSKKEKKRRPTRQSSTKLVDRESSGSSQWYTTPEITADISSIVPSAAPVFELRQEVRFTIIILPT